ncbi:protein of unknown function [Succiniclasticum ruminis]|uniref:DUF4422 domain-containing protein n=1 Tax=Succiniclasticum ruminis TaxID=40841 RepID=A0A1G6I105_9FIRM|nr:DUF4422 domain-containing protein [Succiniclasticum ruminis]SDC00239.1 protein of unknown function [Succiniclasticum ruminis]
MDIKILVATHKKYWMPEDEVYLPLHVGAEGKADLGYTKDNTGDNISIKNPNYCELTGLYWAWKNLQADYIGLVHYRRYFTIKEIHNIELKKKQILKSEDWQRLLLNYPVVVPDKRKYYIETNRSHYNHAHPSIGLDKTERIINEKCPEYSCAFTTVMNRSWAHMFNMFVMRQDLFLEYCQWLFGILFELEERLDISEFDAYNSRVFGFVSERLLDVWLEKNRISYYEQNVSFMEPQNWLKKGGLFLKRKFIGQ